MSVGVPPGIAFLPFRELRFPRNNREYFLSQELRRRGIPVYWFLQQSGVNRGVELEWPLVRYADLDVRGRTYFLPVYLAWKMRRLGIRVLWLSGWAIRSLSELRWLVDILRVAGIRVVFDPVDPICEHDVAMGKRRAAECIQRARRIYQASALTVCVTPEMLDLLASQGAPRDRMVVGRWCTDPVRFDPSRTRCDLKDQLGLDARTFLVGWLGTMEPFRGMMEVVLPMIERMASRGLPLHFVIAGKGTLEAEIRAWAAARPHLPLTVLGQVPYDEAPNFTGSLDAYLVPTDPSTPFGRAICPIKVFDALMMGTPVIVTRTAATDFLAAHRDLVTFTGFDVDSLEQAVLERFEAPRRDPHAPSRPDVLRYSHQAVSVEIADAIERVLEQAGGGR